MNGGLELEPSSYDSPEIGDAPCDWCERQPDVACPACNARRRRAVRLVEQCGVSVAEVAQLMGLSLARVERLLEEQADRRLIERFVGADIENALLRKLLVQKRR